MKVSEGGVGAFFLCSWHCHEVNMPQGAYRSQKNEGHLTGGLKPRRARPQLICRYVSQKEIHVHELLSFRVAY